MAKELMGYYGDRITVGTYKQTGAMVRDVITLFTEYSDGGITEVWFTVDQARDLARALDDHAAILDLRAHDVS